MTAPIQTLDATEAAQAVDAIVQRAEARYDAHRQEIFASTDRMFGWLMIGQWMFGIFLALAVSPYAWEGKVKTIHAHVWVALILGGVLSALPVYLARKHPGEVLTRHVIAVAQLLWSALLIHLTGGRIETHFHVFGSLAILTFYRDWPVVITGAAVTALNHFFLGVFWPESIYGIANPEWWRFLEHAGWVLFCISFMIIGTSRGQKDMRVMADRGAELEALSENAWRNSSVVDRVTAKAAGT